MQGNRPLGVRTLTPRRYAGRMLARRLLVLAAVLLALGAVAASLAPRDLRGPATTTVPPAVAPRPSPAPSGSQPVVLSVNAAGRRPANVTARVGEHVRLNVLATQPDSVAVLDQTEPVDPYSPAMFDLLLDAAGDFPVTLVQSGRRVATLRVLPAR